MSDLKKKINLILLNIVKSESACIVIGQSYLLPAMHVNSSVLQELVEGGWIRTFKRYSYFSTKDLLESTNT